MIDEETRSNERPRESLELEQTSSIENEKLRTSAKSNEYFIPDTGTALDVMKSDILRYLGKDAAVRSGSYEDPQTGSVQQGYIITSRVEPTMGMIAYRSRDELPPIISLRDNVPLVAGQGGISNAHGLQDEELLPPPPSEPSVVPDPETGKKRVEEIEFKEEAYSEANKLKTEAVETEKPKKAAADGADKARKEAEDALQRAIAAGASPDTPKKPLRFKDAVGRKFSFPFHLCAKWVVSKTLAIQLQLSS